MNGGWWQDVGMNVRVQSLDLRNPIVHQLDRGERRRYRNRSEEEKDILVVKEPYLSRRLTDWALFPST